jgi:predicted DCC family thiol-disulfide oxidoreductase YuxK
MEDGSPRRSASLTEGDAPVLLYDGACGLCAESVRLILRHERTGTLRFAALQGPTGTAIRARHPELAGVDSMIWVDAADQGARERVLARSDAALRIAAYLGGVWLLAAPARLLPRWLRDAVYGFIARHRHRISRSLDACVVPPPHMRRRFID